MAGMPGRSGGPRQGTPGKQYTNRSDLAGDQPIRAVPSQQYGQRKAAEDAQRAVPLPQMPAPGAPEVALGAPTARPDEPVTAGLPFGDGPGPESLGLPTGPPISPESESAARLRGLYMARPTEDLRALLEYLDMIGI